MQYMTHTLQCGWAQEVTGQSGCERTQIGHQALVAGV